MQATSISLLFYLLFLVSNAQEDCLLASNGNRPLPPFVRPQEEDDRFQVTPVQAIITSYQFNCCGVITEWRAFVERSGGAHFREQPYDISFQVWRPNSPSPVDTDGCYTMTGANTFFSIPLADPTTADRGIVTGRPSESERIEVQPRDVVGFHLVSRRSNDEDDNEDDGIQFDRDYSSESVWYASGVATGGGTCQFPVGSQRALSNSTNIGPLITATVSQSVCPIEPTTTTPATAPTPTETSSQLPTPALFSSIAELSSTAVVDQQTRFDSSSVSATPRVTTNGPTVTDNGTTTLLIAVIVPVVAVSVIVTLLVIIGAGIVLKNANKSSEGFTLTRVNLRAVIKADGEVATTTQTQPLDRTMVSNLKDYDYPDNVESINSSMTKNEACGDISGRNNDPQVTQNPAFDDTSTVGRTAEAMVHSTQDGSDPTMRANSAYGKLRELQIREETYDYVRNPDSAICDPSYGDITTTAGGDQDYYVNEGLGGAAEVRTTRNEHTLESDSQVQTLSTQ